MVADACVQVTVGEGRRSETEVGKELEWHLEPQSLADYSSRTVRHAFMFLALQ